MDNVAVVTDAASGPGAALCRLLAAQGVAVVAADIDAAGVRVSVAVPGGVATDIVDSGIDLPGYSYRAPLRRMPIGMTGSERAARHILRGMRKNRPYIAHRWCPGLLSRLGGRR
ncbi:hypothetical protein [Nocardia sp. NPDC059691]|uniref:hypothetical protein n=1 Tax=Nocardia sp. NPDC059691 TaxID=3346908 RepID=UPI0036A4DBB0